MEESTEEGVYVLFAYSRFTICVWTAYHGLSFKMYINTSVLYQ